MPACEGRETVRVRPHLDTGHKRREEEEAGAEQVSEVLQQLLGGATPLRRGPVLVRLLQDPGAQAAEELLRDERIPL